MYTIHRFSKYLRSFATTTATILGLYIILFFPKMLIWFSEHHMVKTQSFCQREAEMSQLSLNTHVFGGPVLFHRSACPSIPTCGISLLTSALALDGGEAGVDSPRWRPSPASEDYRGWARECPALCPWLPTKAPVQRGRGTQRFGK